MNKISFIIGFICLVCSCTHELKGTIVEKKIMEEKTDTTFNAVVQGYQVNKYPKTYQVVLDNGFVYDVTKQDYDRIKIGDTYVYGTGY